jgi:PAS domain S-box-containing protein
VATIHLRTGRKAKASAAYGSACVYFAAGTALIDEKNWGSQYELMFSLWLERAECEFLSGNFDKAEQFIVELLQRGASKVDQAAAYQLKVLLHTVKSENPQAVASALTCLRLFGVDIPANPTSEQVQAEYETIWCNLEGRPIENLIDLPPMTDPELHAAMQVLSTLLGPAYFTDFHLFCLLVCRMVTVSMRHGMCGASAHGCAYLGTILGPVFHRYGEGYRFANLACDLVEKHGFIAYQAKAYHSMGIVAVWTQPIATAIDFNRAAFRAAIETGDLTSACYSMDQSVTSFLVRNDPLDAVWRESEKSLDFVRRARFHDVAAAIVSQQRYIATMQGRTATFSTFSDAQFDEAAFEAELTGERTPTMVCLYWIVKLKTRFQSGDYAEAIAAADKAKALLWASPAHIQLLDYFYYTALMVAALYENATPDEQNRWRELLRAHREQLREWAENYPPTFGEKHALVSAEIARLENRDLDAMQLYEEAIRAARENGFVQSEGLANELAAQFYQKRGIEKVAHSYLRESRYCYLRWGALGKVQQLDGRYPHLPEERAPVFSADTIGTSVEQLDLGTVMKASHAVAGEIVLEKLIKTLMMIVVEHAGAERGLLILPHGEEHQIAAEARTGRGTVEVHLRQALVTPAELPDSLFRYVMRTQESVILDDASIQNLFSEDEYVRQQRPKSTLCLPLVKQAKLMGVLYLENSLVRGVFTPKRLAMLELLASQAAISLDHARLYAELTQENSDRRKAEEALKASEERWRKLFENSSAGIALVTPDGCYTAANVALQKILGYTEEELQTLTALEVSHEGDRVATEAIIAESADRQRRDYRIEKRYRRKDGHVIWADVSSTLVPPTGSAPAFFATVVVDITERKRAEEALQKAQAELAHVTRVVTLGELTASIAHEINQPLGALVNNASACLRWLAAQNLEEARQSATLVIADGHRAGEIISRIRALAKKAPPQKERLDINEAIGEVIAMARTEVQKNRVSLQTQLGDDLPLILGDKIQLQQVILNLLVNAIEAMSGVAEGPRELWVSSDKVTEIPSESEEDKLKDKGLAEAKWTHVLIAVRDSGPGLDPKGIDRVFDAFYTTKSQGLGMGLAISRSIIEAHGGRLWATTNTPQGAIFQFALPICDKRMS